MGKSFSVDYSSLSEAAKKLKDISDNYERISGELMEKATTMGTAWESADNRAFTDQIKGFADDLKNMSDKLEEASQRIEAQGNNYKTHSEDNIAQIGRLAN